MTRPTNHRRAQLAATALKAFAEETGGGGGDEQTLMLDLITDLGHLAASRKLDFVRMAAKAVSVWFHEHKNAKGFPSPQVTVTIAGRRPKCAWTKAYL